MIRCAKAGYIEVPSKFRECAKADPTDGFSGFDHHRWIVEPMADYSGLIFKAKLAWAHHRDYLGQSRRDRLNDYFFNGFFWSGSFKYVEYLSKGMHWETIDLEYFYDHFPYDRIPNSDVFDLTPNASDPQDGRCFWVTWEPLPPVLPADFDAVRYVNLHPDVKEANIDGVHHYLNHGYFEGRRYK